MENILINCYCFLDSHYCFVDIHYCFVDIHYCCVEWSSACKNSYNNNNNNKIEFFNKTKTSTIKKFLLLMFVRYFGQCIFSLLIFHEQLL